MKESSQKGIRVRNKSRESLCGHGVCGYSRLEQGTLYNVSPLSCPQTFTEVTSAFSDKDWPNPQLPLSAVHPQGCALCTLEVCLGGMRGVGQPVMGPWHLQVGVFLSGTAVKMLSYHSVQTHNVSQQTQLSHVLFACHL